MKTSTDLTLMGKQLATEYVSDNTPLNTGLKKLAETNNLNKEEMARVAETANVDAYLKLIDKSDEKYLEFPLADYNQVYSEIHGTEKAAEVNVQDSDYENLWQFSKNSIEEDNSFQKVASADNPYKLSFGDSPKYIFKLAQDLKARTDFIEQEVLSEIQKTDSIYEKAYQMVKQAVLQDTDFSKIAVVINSACGDMSEDLISSFDERFKKETRKNFDKTASVDNTLQVNTNSDFYKIAKELENQDKYLMTVVDTYENHVNDYNSFLNTHNIPSIKKTAGVFKGIKASFKKFPKATTALAVSPIVYLGTKAGISSKERNILDRYKAYLALQQAKKV